jgi:putative addiction module component (TIGR02574 family)
MSNIEEQICTEALGLPRASRAELAERLLMSLEEDIPNFPTETAWKAEIQRRSSEIHEGRATLRTAEEVMRNALQAIS